MRIYKLVTTKRIWIFCIISAVILTCTVVYKMEVHRRSITEKYVIDYAGVSNLEISEDKKNFCFITSRNWITGPTIVDDLYLLDQNRSGTLITEGYRYCQAIMKSYEINVYDIKNGNLLTTLDIMPSLEQISDHWQSGRNYIGSAVIDGEAYVCISIKEKPLRGESDYKAEISSENEGTLFVSLKDNHFFVKTYEEDENYVFEREESQVMKKYLEFLEANGFDCFENTIDYLPSHNNICQIQLQVNKLPSKNEKLYNMFPGLKAVPRDSGKYVYIFLKDQPDDLSLLELIFEDDQEKYFEENLEHAWSDYETEEEKEEYRQLAEDYIKFKESKAENKDK